MEVQTVNNVHNTTAALLSSLQAAATITTTTVSGGGDSSNKSTRALHPITDTSVIEKLSKTPTAAVNMIKDSKSVAAITMAPNNNATTSCSNSPASSNSELETELHEIDLNASLNSVCKSNGSLSGASSTTSGALANTTGTNSAATAPTTTTNGAYSNNAPSTTAANGTISATMAAQIKKRISSSRTPTRKARRIKFYRNGDRFYPGITIPVSNERYRSFESLYEDLTRLLEESVKIPGAVRTIYTMCGKKVSTLEELEDGQSYVCSCNNENFKKIEYNMTSIPLANLTLANKPNSRITKIQRPASPMKNGVLISNILNNSSNSTGVSATSGGNGITTGTNGGSGGVGGSGSSPLNTSRFTERDSVVHPRIVTLIRNGTKPRKIMRLLLNKRNSPSFDHVLTAITQVVKLDTGYVRKVFTLSGGSVQQLADFFGPEDVFFAYGTERVNNVDDFKLEPDEQKAINAIRKTLRTAGTACKGPKPKMPMKSKKNYAPTTEANAASGGGGGGQNAANAIRCTDNGASAEEEQLLASCGMVAEHLPATIREKYALSQIIGDGNFAIVLKVKDRQTGQPCALKMIDKSKCKGKEHYIDAEVRVMKKLQHPHIISLIMEVDYQANMYLVLEYVSGGDLFDAITRVTRFSELQSRIMIRHLGSAMSYLHAMGIVHRDIKPENLLVELDEHGNVLQLKLADFGLASEVTEPLYAVCGTPTYVAPEILLEVGYGLKIDVWAAGIILYILLCGFPPFVAPDNNQELLFDAIISGIYEFPDPYWSDIGDGVRDLIANMLQSDPDVRFTSEDILDHYWTMGNDDDDDNDDVCGIDYNR